MAWRSHTTMVRPPPPPPPSDAVPRKPPPPPIPPARKNNHRPPPPPRPPGKPRPPPPPPLRPEARNNGSHPPPKRAEARSNGSFSEIACSVAVAGNKRPVESTAAPAATVAPNHKQQRRCVSLKALTVMRDVTAFQKNRQVGEGTYGSVFLGADKVTGAVVALKRINTEAEANGFPITAIREVKILKALCHDNVVKLQEVVTSKDQGGFSKNVFMVMEYLEYDLTGIIETPEIRITEDHIKSWSSQLLKGVHYMHMNNIMHRDLKASNLLISSRGVLKIADFGLARTWSPQMKRLTNPVITLWYRPPELLLGAVKYSPKIDLWSTGCIIAEMFRRGGLLKGANEAHQLNVIFASLGHPTVADWPDIHEMCPLWKDYAPAGEADGRPRRLQEELKSRLPAIAGKWMTPCAVDILDHLLAHNPAKRWSAGEALTAEWFFEAPMVKPAAELNMNFRVESVHEWEARKKHKELMAQRKAAQAAGGSNFAR